MMRTHGVTSSIGCVWNARLPDSCVISEVARKAFKRPRCGALAGGSLMNWQKLETAVRLKTPFVNVIWENRQFGSIVWKQEKTFGRQFATEFGNSDFVKLVESFGMLA